MELGNRSLKQQEGYPLHLAVFAWLRPENLTTVALTNLIISLLIINNGSMLGVDLLGSKPDAQQHQQQEWGDFTSAGPTTSSAPAAAKYHKQSSRVMMASVHNFLSFPAGPRRATTGCSFEIAAI